MTALALPLTYIVWHYTTALKNVWQTFTNYLWFVWHFFSIPVLAKTLFAPWRRLREETPGHAAEDLLVNAVLRGVGVLIRGMTIIFGVISLLIALIAGVLFYVVWIVLPFSIIGLFLFGIISLTLP